MVTDSLLRVRSPGITKQKPTHSRRYTEEGERALSTALQKVIGSKAESKRRREQKSSVVEQPYPNGVTSSEGIS